jgi:hypothetical protein
MKVLESQYKCLSSSLYYYFYPLHAVFLLAFTKKEEFLMHERKWLRMFYRTSSLLIDHQNPVALAFITEKC